jgi:hypothetical protein
MPALIERASVTKTLQLMTDHVVPANSCISRPHPTPWRLLKAGWSVLRH